MVRSILYLKLPRNFDNQIRIVFHVQAGRVLYMVGAVFGNHFQKCRQYTGRSNGCDTVVLRTSPQILCTASAATAAHWAAMAVQRRLQLNVYFGTATVSPFLYVTQI